MQRGDKVIAKAYKGEPLIRIVWEENNGGLLLCGEEEFHKALKEEREAIGSGFPRHDVFPYKESWFLELQEAYEKNDTQHLVISWNKIIKK